MSPPTAFAQEVKDALAKRAGFRCSRPHCRCVTVGPSREGKDKFSMPGDAAHIFDASQGPRARRVWEGASADELHDIANGIWLCPTCHRLVDRDRVSYPAPVLLRWKRQAEGRAARELGTKPDGLWGEPVRYIVGVGWQGIREVGRGTRGVLATQFGYRVVETPVMQLVRKLMREDLEFLEGDLVALDVAALASAGADVRGLREQSPMPRWLRAAGIRERECVRAEYGWYLREEAGCDGTGELEALVGSALSSTTRGAKRRARLAKMTAWMADALGTRPAHDDQAEVCVPVLKIQEPEIVCLAVENRFSPHDSLELLGDKVPLTSRVEVGRQDMLFPLGIVFDGAAAFGPSGEGEDLGDIEVSFEEPDTGTPPEPGFRWSDRSLRLVSTGRAAVPLPQVAEMFAGPSLAPQAIRVTDETGGVVELSPIRDLRLVRDYLGVEIGGRSCPEVFVQRGAGPWHHHGPVLVGAGDTTLSRTETSDLGAVEAGQHIGVVVREVPGETAFVRCALFVRSARGDVELGRCEPMVLVASNLVHFEATASCSGTVHLEVSGYFLRTFPDELRQVSRTHPGRRAFAVPR